MGKNKLKHFEENKTFPMFIQPSIQEVKDGFYLKNKWAPKFFKNNHPIILELGCGKGEYTVSLARKFPEMNYIGVDIKGARMWRGARTAFDEALVNIAFLRTRIDLLGLCFGKNEVSDIWITFPDPQTKQKKMMRRLTSPHFLHLYSQILISGGKIYLKTDNTELYNFTLDVIRDHNHKLLYETGDLYSTSLTDVSTQVQTHYEKIYLARGHKIKFIIFSLNPEPAIAKQDLADESFFKKVYEVVQQIPFGKVSTYGAIGEYLGSKGSARMVGWAMNASHSSSYPIPAHRVVNRNGMLTGKHHFGSPDLMQQLLENEGHTIIENKIVGFEKVFWNPSTL